jgi:GntR family transcriptional regulator/MocR family aminotransferase
MVLAKRAHAALLPLLEDPDSSGLTRAAQVYKTLLRAIIDGRLPSGTRLPSARVLAADWKISRNTIDEAFARLQADGLIVRGVGAGTFVADKGVKEQPRVRAAKLRQPSEMGRRVLDQVSHWGRSTSQMYAPQSSPRPEPFLGGLPALDLFPIEVWQRLILRRLRASGRNLLGYFDTMGYAALRETTARYLAASRGVQCTADQVMILNSSVQALDLISRVLLEPDDEVWVEDPTFPNAMAALATPGIRVVPVPVDEHGIDVDQGIRSAPEAGLVYVTPSCQYPTGVTLSLERRLQLLRWAEQSGAWIVEDDYQSEFKYEGHALASIQSLDRGERVLYVGTFTNAMFPSLRLAYLVMPKGLTEVFRAVRGQLDDHTHGLLQVVLADFMDAGHFSSHLRKMKTVYQARRDALLQACRKELPPSVCLGPTSAGMNAALYLPPGVPDRQLVERAARDRLRLAPLSRYGLQEPRLNGVLLGYAALTAEEIAQGVAQLGAGVSSQISDIGCQ